MSIPHDRASLIDGAGRGLIEALRRDPTLEVVDADGPETGAARVAAAEAPGRYRSADPRDPTWLAAAAERSLHGGPVAIGAPASEVTGFTYGAVRGLLGFRGASVKLLGSHEPMPLGRPDRPGAVVEDLGVMRGVPGMTVLVPADAPSAQSAVEAVAARTGPAYVRLTRELLPTVTHGPLQIGRAAVLREGGDVTVAAVGAMVVRSLELAAELSKVGVSARVLDLGSVKPFDAPAVLRAARETGALLVAEEHSVTTGVGSLVATVTAENVPVPVRRVGLADVFEGTEGPGAAPGALALSLSRMMDEAWELLRLRGKVE